MGVFILKIKLINKIDLKKLIYYIHI
jgi:hypothetical protein